MPSLLDQLTDALESGNVATVRALAKAKPKPQPRPMADISAMVFFPWPESWPLPSPEEIAADAQRRARFYARGKGAK